MSAEHLPPRPWSFMSITPQGKPLGNGHVYLLDANGRKIASLWGNADEKIATAELVCDAANGPDFKPSAEDLGRLADGLK